MTKEYTYKINLNCARNCIKYIIRAYNIKEINIPYYTCPVVWQSVLSENCKVKFYHINKDFMPEKEFYPDEYIIYNNYYGIMASNVKKLAKQYKNIIFDNAQAFYMPHMGLASFNSLRKFFNIPDGAFLYINKKNSENFEFDKKSESRHKNLIKIFEKENGAENKFFIMNEESFNNELIKYMSELSKNLYKEINIQELKKERLEKFAIYDRELNANNEINIISDQDNAAMFYPYLSKNKRLRQELKKNGFNTQYYWNTRPEETQEGYIQKYLLPLPINSNFSVKHIKEIIKICKRN